jgi:hypothetical protein
MTVGGRVGRTHRIGCNFSLVFDTPGDVEIRYEITTDLINP